MVYVFFSDPDQARQQQPNRVDGDEDRRRRRHRKRRAGTSKMSLRRRKQKSDHPQEILDGQLRSRMFSSVCSESTFGKERYF